MKKTFLISIAALLLATGTAHAVEIADYFHPTDAEVAAWTAEHDFNGVPTARKECDQILQAEGFANVAYRSCIARAEPNGEWEDCSSHNLPERPACVGRPCNDANWLGPENQCSPKALSPKWLARTDVQSKPCSHKYLRPFTFKGVIRYDRCMERFRNRHKLGKD